MLENVRDCTKCKLCCNQRPLMDRCECCQVLWVGLSAKKTNGVADRPLSKNTNSGAIIHRIEELLKGVSTYKTNLVKCAPLDDFQKLRYPNQREIDECFSNLEEEINTLTPKVVFLLGEKVYSAVSKHYGVPLQKMDGFNYRVFEHKGVYYVPVHHPSYIHVYKRKYIDTYIEVVRRIICSLLDIK